MLQQANATLTHTKPWASDPMLTYASYVTSLETLRITGVCLQPFMPGTAQRLLDALGVAMEERFWQMSGLGSGNVGDVEGVTLFERKKEEGLEKGGKGKTKKN